MKNFKFYSLMFIISFLIGYLPIILFEPRGGWTLEGIFFYYYWFLIFIADITIILIRIFKNKITPNFLKKASVIYFIILLPCFIHIIIGTLYLSDNYRTLFSFLLKSHIIKLLIIMIIIGISNYYLYKSAKNYKSTNLKLFTIVTVSIVITFIINLCLIPNTIKVYKTKKSNNLFNKIIAENNLEECLKLKSEYFCKKELSIKHNNIDMCLELPDSSNGDWRYSMRYNCLYKIAINKLDENICDLVDKYIHNKRPVFIISPKENCKKAVLRNKNKK